MKSLNTSSDSPRRLKKQILWFIGAYLVSITAIGAFYFVVHIFLGWIA
jgi:hypothetical protein